MTGDKEIIQFEGAATEEKYRNLVYTEVEIEQGSKCKFDENSAHY